MRNRASTGSRCSRRTLLQIGWSGLLGVGSADLLRAESTPERMSARATGLIMIWLGGGPATIDMWDPKPDVAREVRGEFDTIETALPGVRFSQHLARTAEIINRGVLMRSLHHNIPDHTPGAQYVMTGNKPSAALTYPSIGSLAAKLLPTSAGMPPYFTIGEAANTGAGFLGAAYDPFRFSAAKAMRTKDQPANDLNGVVLPASMSPAQLDERRRMQELFNARFVERHRETDLVPTFSRFQLDSHDILASNRIGSAFDLTGESEATLALYGQGEVGRSMLVARRLIEAGARFVTVGTSGWDTHVDNFSTLRRLLPPLDKALAALVTDLDQRGLSDKTLLLCGGEFGRTPVVNNTAGRDHWSRVMTWFASGGGLKRGYVHGSSDARGNDPADAPCSPDDLAATALQLLGFPADSRVTTTAGRPVKLFESGRAIGAIMA
ncbi:MAG TPA: DUF1501 domain-containing protein [Pirellulales bacterium]|jgi:hypothetical protein